MLVLTGLAFGFRIVAVEHASGTWNRVHSCCCPTLSCCFEVSMARAMYADSWQSLQLGASESGFGCGRETAADGSCSVGTTLGTIVASFGCGSGTETTAVAW